MFGQFSPTAAEWMPANRSFPLELQLTLDWSLSHLEVEAEHVDDDDMVEHWVSKAGGLLSHQLEGGLHHPQAVVQDLVPTDAGQQTWPRASVSPCERKKTIPTLNINSSDGYYPNWAPRIVKTSQTS